MEHQCIEFELFLRWDHSYEGLPQKQVHAALTFLASAAFITNAACPQRPQVLFKLLINVLHTHHTAHLPFAYTKCS